VIESLINPFRCPHRRTTFPMTPVKRKTGGDQSDMPTETYVVCLDCGKQFRYDWEHMRLGQAVDISDGTTGGGPPEAEKIPFRTKSKLRYLFLGSALSAVWLVGRAARKRSGKASGAQDGQAGDLKNPKTPRHS